MDRRKIIQELIILAGFLILPFLIYGDVTLGSNTMIPADNLFQWEPWKSHATEFGLGQHPQNHLLSDLVIQNYVWKSYINDTVSSGDLPLWNPHLFAGAPFIATGQNAFWYPFSLIFLAMPLAKA
ncbi:MAG: hypothetical protein AB8G95_17780, partial [Anaerolineae bacterium]